MTTSDGIRLSLRVQERSGPEAGAMDADQNLLASTPASDFCRLYADLTRQDDEPACLIAAARCLRLRLREVEAAARERGGDGAAFAGPAPVAVLAVPNAADGSIAPQFPALVDWLTNEPLVLQRTAQAASGENPVHLLLFGIYRRWRTGALGIQSAADRGPAALPGRDLEPAVIRHALSCSPSERLLEIIGYFRAALQRLAELSANGTFGTGSVVEPVVRSGSLVQAADHLILELPAVEAALNLWLDLFAPHSHDRKAAMERLAVGAALHESLWSQVVAAERQRRAQRRDPTLAFIEGLRSKVRYATGYHSGVQLAGRSLDDWFGEEPFNTEAFLDALADSSWVDRMHPEYSRILQLVAFQGPMFGIFPDAECDGLRAWLDKLSQAAGAAGFAGIPPEVRAAEVPTVGLVGAMRTARRCEPEQAAFITDERPTSAELGDVSTIGMEGATRGRQLFHRLLKVESDPAALLLARQHAETCLAATSGRAFARRPFPYRPEAFVDFIEQRYREQLKGSREPRSTPRLSREAYRFGIEQLAPAILVDGCWLQRTDPLHADSPAVAERLGVIYADELGNGVMEHNHPLVYRRLLESLGIDLPPVASPEFARHPAFLNEAFDLPVFMLSISLSPHRFLPELLGLNLAIELSGLGSSYSRVARELEHWGIDSKIVRLHQSIDNLAGGHAALARDCVMIHLDQVRALGGAPSVQQHWRRVWTGFRSLGTVTRRFRWQLVLRYGTRAAGLWLSSVMVFGRRDNALSGGH